jgi:hypothetical protein
MQTRAIYLFLLSQFEKGQVFCFYNR